MKGIRSASFRRRLSLGQHRQYTMVPYLALSAAARVLGLEVSTLDSARHGWDGHDIEGQRTRRKEVDLDLAASASSEKFCESTGSMSAMPDRSRRVTTVPDRDAVV